jgi:hypothetical protein
MAGWPVVDWATVVTGVVGLAGIGGTLLSAKLTSKSDAANLRTSIAAEDARAKVAEKRRIYANCLAALSAYVAAKTVPLTNLPPEAGIRFREEINRTQLAAANAVYEVQLIGPSEVALLANTTLLPLLNADRAAPGLGIGKAIGRLTTAMRLDLGEQVLVREDETPSALDPPSHQP